MAPRAGQDQRSQRPVLSRRVDPVQLHTQAAAGSRGRGYDGRTAGGQSQSRAQAGARHRGNNSAAEQLRSLLPLPAAAGAAH